jgi:hypothetical protein
MAFDNVGDGLRILNMARVLTPLTMSPTLTRQLNRCEYQLKFQQDVLARKHLRAKKFA